MLRTLPLLALLITAGAADAGPLGSTLTRSQLPPSRAAIAGTSSRPWGSNSELYSIWTKLRPGDRLAIKNYNGRTYAYIVRYNGTTRIHDVNVNVSTSAHPEINRFGRDSTDSDFR